MTPSRSRVYLIVVVMGVYLISFAISAVDQASSGSGEFHSRGGPVLGAIAFVLGALMMLGGCPSWLANPALWIAIGLLACQRMRAATISASIALCFAPTIFLFQDATVRFKPLEGIWLWFGSMALMASGSAALWMWQPLRSQHLPEAGSPFAPVAGP